MQRFHSARRIYRSNFFHIVLVAVMMLIPSEFGFDSAGAHLAAWLIVVFFAHLAALLGTQTGAAYPVDPILPEKDYPTVPKFGFWALMLGYGAILFGLAFLILPIILQGGGGELSEDQVLGRFLLAMVMPVWFLFSALGTAIPASAIAHKTGFWRALKRARYTFWRTAGWLLLGPGVIYGLGFGLVFAAQAAGLYAHLPGTIAGLSMTDILEYPVINALIGGLATSTVAAILSQSYLIGDKRIAAKAASVPG